MVTTWTAGSSSKAEQLAVWAEAAGDIQEYAAAFKDTD